jgi:putative transcriptional regulator
MYRINLAVLLAKKKMNLSDLYRATGIRLNTLSDYYHEIALSIKFDHVEKICSVLGCTPNDLIEIVPKRVRKKKLQE